MKKNTEVQLGKLPVNEKNKIWNYKPKKEYFKVQKQSINSRSILKKNFLIASEFSYE